MAVIALDELQLLRSANRDVSWLGEHYAEVVSEHDNEFVAVANARVVAASPSMSELIKKLVAKGLDPKTTLIKFVTKAAVILQTR